MKTHKMTLHYDSKGEMIHRHDTVRVVVRPHYIKGNYAAMPSRTARVLWVGDAWTLWYGGRETEPLNHYDAKELIRVPEPGETVEK